VRDSRGAVGPPSRKEQTKRVLLQPPGPARTRQLRNLGFIPKGRSPGRTQVKSTGGPGAGIASALALGGMRNTFGLPIAGGIGLAKDVRHPVEAVKHPLRVGQHLAEAGAPLDELPFALARALRIGGGASRLGQMIAGGPEYSEGWKLNRHGDLVDEEGNLVTGRYPRQPSHIKQRVPIEGGSAWYARKDRPNDYFIKALEAYGRLKSGGSYIWEYPGMNIVQGRKPSSVFGDLTTPRAKTVWERMTPAERAKFQTYYKENLDQRRQAMIDTLQHGGNPDLLDYDVRHGGWWYPYKGYPHDPTGNPRR
jgi:hypothetical protein